jgi:hypothetical protein
MKEEVYRVTNTSRFEFDLGATLPPDGGESSQIRKLGCLQEFPYKQSMWSITGRSDPGTGFSHSSLCFPF